MKLGDVLKKERERKKLTVDDVAARLNVPSSEYSEIEAGTSPAELWGPRLALIAIALQVPTSRLIAETGKHKQTAQVSGQCGKLIRARREDRNLSQPELAQKIDAQASDVESIENGDSPLEHYAPILLGFAETIDQPIFNLFYPCGLPLDKLTDYP